MPVIQFKGKTAIESYHHTIPHHTLEFDPKLSVLPKGEKPSLDGNLIIEGDGHKVPWQKLAEDFRDNTFRLQVLDEGEYAGSEWRDELRRHLEQATQGD